MEQIWFRDDEIEILVVDLGQVFGRARGDGLGAEVFEKGPWYAGKEVDVGRAVQAAGEIGGDDVEILRGGLDEIDDGHIGDHMAGGADVEVDGDLVAR